MAIICTVMLRFVVLVGEGFDGLAHQDVLVLRNWICGLLILIHGYELFCFFDSNDIQHLPIKKRHVK
jgi:hypothetical protein